MYKKCHPSHLYHSGEKSTEECSCLCTRKPHQINAHDVPDDDDEYRRVAICHGTGNGDYHTIYVSQNAVQAHLNHGDYLGPCTEIVVDWQSILPNSDLQMMIIKGKDNKFKKFVKTK